MTDSSNEPAARLSFRRQLLSDRRWVALVLPFAVFVLVGTLEPTPETAGGAMIGLAIPYAWYPWIYTVKIALTVAAIIYVWPGYRDYPLRLTRWSVAAGVVGAAIWIGLCSLQLEPRYLAPLLQRVWLGGWMDAGTRSAFDPFAAFAGHSGWAWAFLAVRLFGLAAVVALIEEAFIRGFLMRYVVDPDHWPEVPFGQVTVLSALVGTLVPMLMHPAELVAAAVWFSMITWLMVKTRSLWDCVAAHAITNLLLGVYVIYSGQWHLL